MAPTTLTGSIGIWGPPTSTLDWCEKNYEVSDVKVYSLSYLLSIKYIE